MRILVYGISGIAALMLGLVLAMSGLAAPPDFCARHPGHWKCQAPTTTTTTTPPPPSGGLFSDDFESGNLSKWTSVGSISGVNSTNQAASGSRSMRSNTSGNQVRMRATFTGSTQTKTTFYVYRASAGDTTLKLADIWAGALHRGILVQGELAGGMRIAIRSSAPDVTIALGPVLAVAAWTKIEITINSGVSPWQVAWEVNDVAQPGGSASIPAAIVNNLDIGAFGWDGQFDVYHDSILVE